MFEIQSYWEKGGLSGPKKKTKKKAAANIYRVNKTKGFILNTFLYSENSNHHCSVLRLYPGTR